MNIYKQMMNESSGLLNDKENTLLSMYDLVLEMITELTFINRKITSHLEDPNDKMIPVNHNYNLNKNDDFKVLYDRYNELSNLL